MRILLIVWVVAALPITLFTYGKGLADLAMGLSWWMTIIVLASHITVWCSIAYLIDKSAIRASQSDT